jgi:hypothetical protein
MHGQLSRVIEGPVQRFQKRPRGGGDASLLLQLPNQRLLVSLAWFHVPAEQVPDVRIKRPLCGPATQQNPA